LAPGYAANNPPKLPQSYPPPDESFRKGEKIGLDFGFLSSGRNYGITDAALILMSPQARAKVLSSRLLARSWRVALYEDAIRYGNGRRDSYARLSVPDFAVAVGINMEDGRVPLVNQYRLGARHEFWELPAGFLEPDETPAACIRREFSEEVGFTLAEPQLVARLYISPARSSQCAYVFRGRIGKSIRRRLDSSEQLTTGFFSKSQALKRLSKRISSVHLLAFLLCADDFRS